MIFLPCPLTLTKRKPIVTRWKESAQTPGGNQFGFVWHTIVWKCWHSAYRVATRLPTNFKYSDSIVIQRTFLLPFHFCVCLFVECVSCAASQHTHFSEVGLWLMAELQLSCLKKSRWPSCWCAVRMINQHQFLNSQMIQLWELNQRRRYQRSRENSPALWEGIRSKTEQGENVCHGTRRVEQKRRNGL